MANQAWLDQYQTAEVNFLSEGTFDHSPCVLSLYPRRVEGKRPFRYFRMWSSHLNFSNKVQAIWSSRVYGTKMYQVISKLKALKPVLKEINKEGFSDMHTAVQRAQGDLENVQQQLQQDPLDIVMIDRELAARAKLIRYQKLAWNENNAYKPPQHHQMAGKIEGIKIQAAGFYSSNGRPGVLCLAAEK
uniref:Uncharacterized protein n=1 Tax=Cannabis sativa TaxID=3483 RepID=A0A803PBM4_CANSA